MANRNQKITIIVIILIILAIGSWWWQKGEQLVIIAPGLNLLDEKKNLVFSEQTNLADEVRLEYEKRVSQTLASLNQGGDQDFLVANYNNLAIYYSYLGNYQQAFQAYQNSLKQISDSRLTLLAFGDLLTKMKAYLTAEFVYQKTLQLNPYEAAGYIKLVNLYKISNNQNKIAEVYKTGLEQTGKNVEGNTLLLDDYAEWLVSLKDYEQAIVIYQKLKELQPDNQVALERKIEQIKKKRGH